jgi:hypothetical protein
MTEVRADAAESATDDPAVLPDYGQFAGLAEDAYALSNSSWPQAGLPCDGVVKGCAMLDAMTGFGS